MARGSAWLAVIVGVLAGSTIAQTPEEITAAIKRLDGPREDARAIEFLIDAGEPAVEPILEALSDDPEDPGKPKFARLLRVLRAMDANASPAVHRLAQLLFEDRSLGGTRELGRDRMCALTATLAKLLRYSPETVTEAAERYSSQPTLPLPLMTNTIANSRLARTLLRTPRGLGTLRVFVRLRLLEARRTRSPDIPSLDGSCPLEREFACDLLDSRDRTVLTRLVVLSRDAEHPRELLFPLEQKPARAYLPQARANEIVQSAAARAIARIDPDHPLAMRGLALMIQSADDPRDRVRAAAALGRHGRAAKDHVDDLLAALDSNDHHLVAETVTALGMIGIADDAVIGQIQTLTAHPRPAIAQRAQVALRVLQQQDR